MRGGRAMTWQLSTFGKWAQMGTSRLMVEAVAIETPVKVTEVLKSKSTQKCRRCCMRSFDGEVMLEIERQYRSNAGPGD